MIKLTIKEVKCIDETGGKWREKIGNDEIGVLGFFISENGSVNEWFGPINIYDSFDDGDIAKFPNGLTVFSLGSMKDNDHIKFGLYLFEKDEIPISLNKKNIDISVDTWKDINEKLEKIDDSRTFYTMYKFFEGLTVGGFRELEKIAGDDIFPPDFCTIIVKDKKVENISFRKQNDNNNYIATKNHPRTFITKANDGVYSITYYLEIS